MNVLATLKQRGFIEQCSDEGSLGDLLACRGVTYYVGFDPSADSLHVGSLVPIMAMAHLQRAGHRPIAIIGGGTGLIGDPSGKTKMRKVLSPDEVESNGEAILAQLTRYFEIDGERGIFRNNADWLLDLRYIDFLRDIGSHFRVNEMLRSEAYQQRLSRQEGLSFIEFNYQLLQAYDFLHLFDHYGCLLQMGGDDQWGNILAGMDLIRRVRGETAFALTFPLLTTSRGQKMGKTEKGTVWLDAKKMSTYWFYQYWINTDDRDVERFLALFTLLPMNEVAQLASLEGEDLREAKEVLAYEVTKLAHGKDEAERAREAARSAFSGASSDAAGIPTTEMRMAHLQSGVPIVDLACESGLAGSRSEARRLIVQGGLYLNRQRVTDLSLIVDHTHLDDGALLLRAGRKRHHRVVAQDE